MSGGEKALSALALLFSIIRVKTIPFVILDEVEAALDEMSSVGEAAQKNEPRLAVPSCHGRR